MPLDIEQMAVLRLERLGDELRSGGRLDEALETFERLLSIAPRHRKAERIVASLARRAVGPPSGPGGAEPFPGGLEPAPFAVLPEFLPRPLHDRLLDLFVANANRFETASIGIIEGAGPPRKVVDAGYRRSAWLLDYFQYVDSDAEREFNERITGSFPAIVGRLGIRPFELRAIEARALIYRDGDFFRAHRDDGGAGKTRRITFLYYLHDRPKRFSGGELVLYDTYFRADGAGVDEPDFSASCTRLSCVDNQLVCFPSAYYHEALPVAGAGDDIRGARLAINGWLHAP